MPDKIVLVNEFGEQSENTLLVDMGVNGKKITNMADPTSNQDAATKKYVDDNGGGGTPITQQINIKFYSANDGVTLLGTCKAYFTKLNNVVTMMLQGPLNWDLTADFATTYSNGGTGPENNPIPAQFRPAYINKCIVNVIDADQYIEATYSCYAEGEIDLDKLGNNFTGTVTVNNNQVICATWVTDPFV